MSRLVIDRCEDRVKLGLYVGFGTMAHNTTQVCDVAPRPKGPRGHVAERRAAAPRSPSRPAGAAMHIRAVMRCVAMDYSKEAPHFVKP